MKNWRWLFLLIGFALTFPLVAQNVSPQPTKSGNPSNSENQSQRESAGSLTLKKVALARRETQLHPDKVQAYNDLALLLARAARETAVNSYYIEAEHAAQTALKLSPNNFQVLKAQVVVLLGMHRFAEARDKAQVLNHRMPDDVSLYGYLARADIELGEYDHAESEAQWMLNLLPNNVPGLRIGADLRLLFGDADGALEFLNQAYSETSPTDVGELAAIALQIASVQMSTGQIEDADQVLQQTLAAFPDYPDALEDLAKVRVAQRKYAAAVDLLRQRNQHAPNARIVYALGQALEKSGKSEQAKSAYAEFEREARRQTNTFENSNRELILYYAEQGKLAEAMEVVSREIAARHDVFTLDAYAWALYMKGQFIESRKQIEKALSVGIRDPQIFSHAARIASKCGDENAAARYSKASLRTTDSHSENAPQASNMSKSSIRTPDRVTTAAEPTSIPILPTPAPTPGRETTARVTDSSTVPRAPMVREIYEPALSVSPTAPFPPVDARLLIPLGTETDNRIRSLQKQISADPKGYKGYSHLGEAFIQKARESGDVSDYDLAEKALRKSLDLVSDDLASTEPLLALAEVYMGEHRFADALTYAQKALSLGSGDLSPFAIVGDAYTDMGEYEKALPAYSKLQPNPSTQSDFDRAYARDSRLSYLRFIAGDTKGAIKLMKEAVAAGSQVQLPRENLAWLYFELGEHYFQDGNAAEADSSYIAALTIYPGNYRAIAGLARVRATQGRYSEAIHFYQKALAVVPMPSYAAELSDVYTKVGRIADAKKQFQLVQYIGYLGALNQVLHNRDLALFYADHDINLKTSLALAKKEFEVRHDIYTWDALAWALHKNGRNKEAAEAIAKALRFNTQDALLFFHAGMIYSSIGQKTRAKEYLSQAISINPHFHVLYAGVAKQHLAQLKRQSRQTVSGRVSNVQ